MNNYQASIYKYQRGEKGLIAKMYASQRQRSREQSKPLPSYDLDQLREWCFSQPVFKKLHRAWIASGYDRAKTPSIDKRDPLGSYTFDNIQLMTWAENHAKGIRERHITQGKGVAQIDPRTKELCAEFVSVSKAAEATGINFRMISAAATGRHKSAGGYHWVYLADFYNKVKGIKPSK